MARSHLVLLHLLLLPFLAACGGEPNGLLLDTVCRIEVSNSTGVNAPGCTVSGDVELTTGVASNLLGVRFGPSAIGELRVRLNAIPATMATTWSLDALAASSRPEGSTLFRALTWGSCGATCPQDPPDVQVPLTEDFQWGSLLSDYDGSRGDPSTFTPVPDDAVLILRGSDVHLLDLRTPGYEPDLINTF